MVRTKLALRLHHNIDDWGAIVKWLESNDMHNGIHWTTGDAIVDTVKVYWIDFYVRRHYNLAAAKWGT